MAKKKKKKTKQRMEFSKKIFICTAILFTLVVIGSLALMWKTDSIEPLTYLIPSTAAMLTGNIAMYTWKSKIENVIKISKEYGLSINEVNSIGKSVANNNSDSGTDYNTDSMM